MSAHPLSRRRGRASGAPRAALIYLAALVGLLLFCGPIAWMLLQASRGIGETLQSPYELLPRRWTLAAFGDALTGGPDGGVALPRALLNSVVYAGASVLTNLALGLPAGYAFARLRFPLRRTLFALVVVAMMVPTAAIVIPLFVVVRLVAGGGGPLGWLNTYQGLILPTAVTGLSIVLVRQFLRQMPRELDEAARLDGCGPYTTLCGSSCPSAVPR